MRMGPGNACQISAQNIRRERTGLHADVALFLFEDPPRLLGRDVFNVGRHEDVVRLCKSVHRRLPPMAKEDYTLEALENDVLYFLLWISRQWESQQFEVEEYDDATPPTAPAFLLFPHILDGGGTILFGPRESAKSYLCILFGTAIANGLEVPWHTEQRPVLYVNLERDPVSMRRRSYHVSRSLGVAKSGIRWLHARGHGMEAVARQVRNIASSDTLVIYDSISRMGLGGLNDDQTANRSSDLANWASRTWLAIGHTPRGDASHLTGSMHFENAADVLTRLTKDEHEGRTGVGLQVVKANDFAKPAMDVIALTFDESGLTQVETASAREFPKLLSSGDDDQGGARGRAQDIQAYLHTVGQATTAQIAESLGMSRQHVNGTCHKSPAIRVHGKGTQNQITWMLAPAGATASP
jgi:hypothetical protein